MRKRLLFGEWGGMLIAVALVGCSDDQPKAVEDDGPPPPLVPTCVPPDGMSGNPTSIDETIALINALPMPVTLECFLQSLDRPVRVHATKSVLSVQPAASLASPRMFIFTGDDKVLMSVTAEGLASNLLEMSELVSDTRSIKAELEMPIQAPVTPELAYERIHLEDTDGTKCGVCHLAEVPVAGAPYKYESRAIAPFPSDKVDLEYLYDHYLNCNEEQKPDRCAILRGVFGYGDAEAVDFPEEMPLFF